MSNNNINKLDIYLITSITLIGIIFRVYLIYTNYNNQFLFISPDSESYKILGSNLLNLQFEYITDRTPIYPIFIEISNLVFKSNYLSVIFSQLIIFPVLIYFLFSITYNIFNKRIAIYAITFCILDISFLFFSLQNLTEYLTAFLILFSIYFYVRERKFNLFFYIFFAIILATLSLTKPMAIFLAYFIFIFLLIKIIFFIKSKKLFDYLKLLICFLIFLSIVSSWSLYNYKNLGIFSISPANFNYMIFYVKKINIEKKINQNNSNVVMCSSWTQDICKIISSSGKEVEYNHELPNDFKKLTYSEKNKFYRNKSIDLIFSYPWEFTKDTLKRIVYITANISDQSILKLLNINKLEDNKFRYLDMTSFKKNFTSLSFQFIFWLVNFTLLLFTWIFFIFGIFKIILKKITGINIIILFTIFIFIFFPSIVGIGNARFRVPIIPLILIYSSLGLDVIIQKVKNIVYKRV